ncbi:glycosyltransferase family 4 protein [Paenibacillus sp. F411]|uniref:glycosyltransferase family 4 protein n=1 Tax=Paenibacillus sp. F411 TaxID=2820239 RepID=UPI001AAF443D|nr:glycosyltransferase family 4 protein [Paenibacillus sp. F411]MBO2943794.1 glycosyltransferase family 4 protein [Paenibacillus sp. F411]
MKICFVTHKVKKGDGQGRVNYEVIVEALRQGHMILVVSSELDEDLRLHPNIEWHQIKVSILPSMLLKYQWFAILSTFFIFVKRKSIQLLIVNGFITYARSDINCVHFVHSAWIKSPYHPFHESKSPKSVYQFIYSKVNSVLERIAINRTKQVIAVSEQVKQELIHSAKINENKITVVPNGVDLNEFYPRCVVRSEFGLHNERIYALFAGDLKSKRKNLETVLMSIARTEQIELLVLGYVDKSPYPLLAEQLGIKHRVHFLGYRGDIAEIMSLSDLFIFPSRYEPFSLVILEAMATGLPVITSNCCGVVELLSSHSAAILEEPDDVDSLVRVLNELLDDRTKLHNMALEARNVAKNNSWEIMSEKYMYLFNKVLNRTPINYREGSIAHDDC